MFIAALAALDMDKTLCACKSVSQDLFQADNVLSMSRAARAAVTVFTCKRSRQKSALLEYKTSEGVQRMFAMKCILAFAEALQAWLYEDASQLSC